MQGNGEPEIVQKHQLYIYRERWDLWERKISSHQCAQQVYLFILNAFRRRMPHCQQSSGAANTNNNTAGSTALFSVHSHTAYKVQMHQQPCECCSTSVEFGLIASINFVGELNKGIDKCFNVQQPCGLFSALFCFPTPWQKWVAEHHLDGQLQQIDLISTITSR